jgi:hypothetical protein
MTVTIAAKTVDLDLKKPKIKPPYKQSKQATVQFKASSKTPNPNPL